MQVLVHLDPRVGVGVDPEVVQVQAVDVRQAAGGDEDVAPGGLEGVLGRLVLVGEDLLGVADEDLRNLDPGLDDEARGGQDAATRSETSGSSRGRM